MDTDVSWANFNNFEPGGQTKEAWDSTPPDGKVLHSNPPTPDEKRNKYQAEGESYMVDDIKSNGVVCGETGDTDKVEKMVTEQWPPVSQEIAS